MTLELFALSETGNESCELTRRAIYFMLARGSTVGSVLGGLVAATDLQVTYAGSGLKVEIAPGEAIIAGRNATQSGYYFRSSSAETKTLPAANPSNPRIERVCIVAKDKSYEGANNEPALEVKEGTATSGATLSNLSGVAAAPNSSITLAYILVPAAATTISNADIKNVGEVVKLGLSPVLGSWTSLESVSAALETALGYYAPGVRLEAGGGVARLRGTYAVAAGKELKPGEVATLPLGFRPKADIQVPVTLNPKAEGTTSGAAYALIEGNGKIRLQGSTSLLPTGLLGLDAITFSLT